ncbi:protein FAM136A-like [Paramacrobiotus metropolitanus]|uniref:protein FAM136A-like n=1 Tax=Paramacrobiotus metropolitanus TaxID=2943436 RepID=UPI002445DBD6|nr:protein FAM136A-like [Paramacrobiotus metropolitanus]XP_055335391.1 protein FAM136A-like [Paramacrobiotus metropolitanus]XP_055356930.1 protein FAM136A-like [Paramacrobiotus metropolitanus]
MEAAQRKVEDAVNKMLTEVDSSHLRKVQGQAFKCCASCCDDTRSSMEVRQNCIGKCMEPVANSQDILAAELSNFQSRIERCVMDCHDQMRDRGEDTKKPSAKMSAGFDACVASCAETHIKLLPSITKKIQAQLAKF